MKIERTHWHYYFGGVALILLIVQLLSGVFLALFYQPHLQEAYASVQGLYKDFDVGAWTRDAHRWAAFFIPAAIVVHIVRSLLRKEFLTYERRTVWLTGSLMLPLLLALLVTGFILPWEWKAYWFMEIVPSHFGEIPVVGPQIKAFLIDAFSINRNFVAHVVIIPVLTIILIDFHVFAKMRRRKGGVPRYLLKHILLTIPFFIAVAVLADYIPMPTEDPEIIPMPLEGANIPTAEWFYLFLLAPFMYLGETTAPLLTIFLPLTLLVLLTVLPYVLKKVRPKNEDHEPGGDMFFMEFRHVLGNALKVGFMRKLVSFLIVVIVAGGVFGLISMDTHISPTLGCNSCHNVLMGNRMGIPPKAFKDRKIVPLLDDNQWMVKHWFYPQVTW